MINKHHINQASW